MTPRTIATLLFASVLTACSNASPDYCGKTCGVDEPCAAGYTCNSSMGTCVATDGHCSVTIGGASSSSGTNGGTSTGGSTSSSATTGGSTTGGSTTGGLISPGGPYALGTSFADQGTLACGGSLGPAQTGQTFANRGILGSRGAGAKMAGRPFANQGGFLGH